MKIVLVTGASTGIGHAAARRLSQRGFFVLAGVRKDADFRAWQGVANVEPVRFDVTDEAQVAEALRQLAPRLRAAASVHLVNNAGIAVAGPVEGVSVARWKEQFEVNVFGLVRATQALLPFIRATRGRIVNMSSVSGLAALPYLGPYAASKFAVEAISDALRRELRPFGCQVVVVEPGPIATPIWEKNLGRKELLLGALSPELQETYGVALGKFERGVQRSARDAVSVDRVCDVVEKSLTLSRPRTRYVVGARALPAAMKLTGLLPDRLLDELFARGLGA